MLSHEFWEVSAEMTAQNPTSFNLPVTLLG